MALIRRRTISALLATAALPLAARAQSYPVKPITLVIPFPPGGHTDSIGRLVADQLSRRLKQPIVVDNKPGVNGSLGTDLVIKARADGYTLLMAGVGTMALNPNMNPNVKYDARRDLTHIALIARNPNVLLASPGFKARDVRELIALAKAAPRSLNFALTGVGSSGHLSMELLKQAAGIDFNAIPYKGDAPATADLLGGQVDLLFLNSVVAVPYVKSGKFRALAVTSGTRNPLLPETPTLLESGLANAVAESWVSVAAPAGLPQPMVDQLNREINEILVSQEVREKFAASGTVAMSGSPSDAAAFVRSEIEKWTQVIKTGNIRAE